MVVDVKIKLNEKLYLRDPQTTSLGEQILQRGLEMISKIGYEEFTFKKLAKEIPTTEASIYRYFENKHKLLFYLVDWYWAFLEFQIMFQINNIVKLEEKIKKIIDLLVWEDNTINFNSQLDHKQLYYLVIAEGSKTYLSKVVDDHNKEELYKPYKDLCAKIAGVFLEFKPAYHYPNSLASTIIEASHQQYFFMHHLPGLGNFTKKKLPKEIEAYSEHLVFGALGNVG